MRWSTRVCSLPMTDAQPEAVAAWLQGHWGTENRLHRVRDMVTGADRHQLRTRNGPQVMATLRNLAISLIRLACGPGTAIASTTRSLSIPYLSMHPDGICKVSENRYSKCIYFSDINYQLAGADEKTAIFENWCDFLNYFDSSVDVQLSFINQGSHGEAKNAIEIPAKEDAFDAIRSEYQNSCARGFPAYRRDTGPSRSGGGRRRPPEGV